MAEAQYLPYHYVDYLTAPGLPATAGEVSLRQYMCKTISNGGNDSATSLFGKLRWMKDGGTGPTLNTLAGSGPMDLALKGQGNDETFVTIWNFMCRNKEQLKTLAVEVCSRRDHGTKVVVRKGNVYDLYFKGHTEKWALQQMVDDRFFGIDCIGFVANFLIFTGEWDKYHGAPTYRWPDWYCTKPVNKATDVKALDFLVWTDKGHIALVDWVWDMVDAQTVRVDVCQSSTGEIVGPQCNERVFLQETKVFTAGRREYKIAHVGSPRMPVTGTVYIMRRNGFFW